MLWNAIENGMQNGMRSRRRVCLEWAVCGCCSQNARRQLAIYIHKAHTHSCDRSLQSRRSYAFGVSGSSEIDDENLFK